MLAITALRDSRYTKEFALPDGKVLFANLLWRTYLELEQAEAGRARQIIETVRARLGGERESHDDLLDRLIETKMLIAADLDEAAFISSKYDASRYSLGSLGLTIAPTIDCNLACVYCYENKRPGRMTPEIEAQLADFVRMAMPGRKTLTITWYGGEPLMCKDAVYRLSEQFIAICKDNNAKYEAFMVTNGLLLTPEVADRLASFPGWRAVQFTIDGNRESHDRKRPARGGQSTFDRIMRNLEYAAEKLPMLIRMNVDRQNPAQCHELLETFAAKGLATKLRVYFANIHPFGEGCRDIAERGEVSVGSNKEFAPIELALRAHSQKLGFAGRDWFSAPWLQSCQAVSATALVVEPDGSLQRCWIEVGEDNKRIGHISRPLDMTSENVLRWLRFDPTRNEPCRDCHVLPLCFGGCPHRHVYGAPEEHTCNQIRYNVEETLVLEYAAKHRADLLPALQQAALGRQRGAADCSSCTQTVAL
jgi:uncharacterized protein